ncbi:hypothetical protein N7510_006492 [Penicillium lagena]|uniref:uncharacterized protein n=1 Tax=Penicillium lagena TaxID=94218 RepID=UPI00253F9926|nr:uncharacterized protein N7510_006492 [Penicillium lagena]KAJ5613298.1 hypothetical protein N7510_006492 [Penicillium lagena]
MLGAACALVLSTLSAKNGLTVSNGRHYQVNHSTAAVNILAWVHACEECQGCRTIDKGCSVSYSGAKDFWDIAALSESDQSGSSRVKVLSTHCHVKQPDVSNKCRTAMFSFAKNFGLSVRNSLLGKEQVSLPRR